MIQSKKFKIGNVVARQGDVGLILSELPKGAKRIPPNEKNREVLAFGEVTGHSHSLYDVKKIEVYEVMNSGITEKYIKTLESVDLIHGYSKNKESGDHDKITLPKGFVFKIEQQMGYNYWNNSPEIVRD